ncbi:MAG TPA: tRNA 2-thiouridine(34) synthase MnmA [Candidatus Paceibacterota bacterium]
MSKTGRKVFVGMSGGVDSSVAAALLKKQGYDVTGIHLKCYNVDGCAEQDAEDARRAAETLQIPFYTLDFEKEYKERVVQYMVEGYRNGITPNPDVMCNKEIKFGLFLDKALRMGADYVATGHYVQIKKISNAYSLYQAKDLNKDQSYVLWTLAQKQLRHCLFPIGEYRKPTVRQLARKFGLPNADKKDSQGICFLGQVTLADFLSEYIPQKKGIIVNASGKIVGEHNGAAFYTIGQRRGLGVAHKKPYYVAEKDIEENAILVAEGEDNPLLSKKEIRLKNLNFISHKPITKGQQNIYARVRYRQPVSKAKLVWKGDKATLTFDKPQKFVAIGQSAVLYKKNGEMIGGGVIV